MKADKGKGYVSDHYSIENQNIASRKVDTC